MNAADTSASNATAACTPLAVVSRSRTTAEIDTFISDVSMTNTNIAIESSRPRRGVPDPGDEDTGAVSPTDRRHHLNGAAPRRRRPVSTTSAPVVRKQRSSRPAWRPSAVAFARQERPARTTPRRSVCLTGKVRSGCRGPLCERDVVPEAFELFDEALGLAFGVALGEVVGAEVAVGLAGAEHVPDRADHGVLDGAERAFVAAAGLEPLVLRGRVVGLDADRGHGGFFEREVQPLRAVARLAGPALAGGLVVAGALAGPRRQVSGRREASHIGPDLGEDAFGAAALDADDRAHQFNRGRERADLLLDGVREAVDLVVEEVDVGEDGADPERVMGVEVPGERFLELRDLLAHLAARELREDLRSVVPATSASSMSRPDLPSTSAATQSSLM